jgi:transcriptional regulator with XRE-family HTH domain
MILFYQVRFISIINSLLISGEADTNGLQDEVEMERIDGEWLKRRFKETGRRKGQLASALGLPHSAVSRLLNDERALKANEIEIIDRFFAGDAPKAALDFKEIDELREDRSTWPDFAKRLQIAVEHADIDLSALAALLEISESDTSAMLAGEIAPPRSRKLRKLARALNVNHVKLLTGRAVSDIGDDIEYERWKEDSFNPHPSEDAYYGSTPERATILQEFRAPRGFGVNARLKSALDAVTSTIPVNRLDKAYSSAITDQFGWIPRPQFFAGIPTRAYQLAFDAPEIGAFSGDIIIVALSLDLRSRTNAIVTIAEAISPPSFRTAFCQVPETGEVGRLAAIAGVLNVSPVSIASVQEIAAVVSGHNVELLTASSP